MSEGIPGSRTKAVLGSIWQVDFALCPLCFPPTPRLLSIILVLASWRAQSAPLVWKDVHVRKGSLSNKHPAEHFGYPDCPRRFPQ